MRWSEDGRLKSKQANISSKEIGHVGICDLVYRIGRPVKTCYLAKHPALRDAVAGEEQKAEKRHGQVASPRWRQRTSETKEDERRVKIRKSCGRKLQTRRLQGSQRTTRESHSRRKSSDSKTSRDMESSYIINLHQVNAPLHPRPNPLPNPSIAPNPTSLRFVTLPCSLTPLTTLSKPVSTTTPPTIISPKQACKVS